MPSKALEPRSPHDSRRRHHQRPLCARVAARALQALHVEAQRLTHLPNRGMDKDPAEVPAQVMKQPLGLAERVGTNDGAYSSLAILGPPAVKLLKDLSLRPPRKNWEPKRALGNKYVARNRLERRAHAIIFGLIVAAENPSGSAVLDEYLG